MFSLAELTTYLTKGSIHARRHAETLADYVPAAHEALRVHLEAGNVVAKEHAQSSNAEQALLLLICHSANLFLETSAMVFAGRFDVAFYLLRPLYDCSTLTRFLALSEVRATHFLEGGAVRASESRIAWVDEIRALGQMQPDAWEDDPGLPDEVNRILKDNAFALNSFTHVSYNHVRRLLEIDGERNIPTVGGRTDTTEATDMLRAVAHSEMFALSQLRIGVAHMMSDEWAGATTAAVEGLGTWIKTHQE